MARFRSIFISDTHLGSRGCQAKRLLDFLNSHETENLFLVGDIIDLWALSRKFYFPQAHVDVVRKIIKMSSEGVRVVYVVGNHDETFRSLLPLTFGSIDVVNQLTHETADGKKFLITHGDDYDQVVKYAKWVAKLGDIGYQLLMRSNRYVNSARNLFGLSHWSLSAFVKNKVKTAANFIGRFEEAVSCDVRKHGVDGVICGHIHHAEIREIDGFTYANDGDWVESCTALIEECDGTLRLLKTGP